MALDLTPIDATSSSSSTNTPPSPVASPAVSKPSSPVPSSWMKELDSSLRNFASSFNNLQTGADKGALNSALGMGNVMAKGFVNPIMSAVGSKPVPMNTPIDSLTQPSNTAQSVGKGAEQFGELALSPETEELGMAAKAGMGAAEFGTKAAVQSGGNPTTTAVGAGLGAAGAPLEAGINLATDYLPKRIVESLIKPSANEFQYGKDAAKGVVKEGIVANTLKELKSKIGSALDRVGSKIEDVVTTPEAAKKIMNVTDVVTKPIDDAISAATKSVSTDKQSLVDRLFALRDSVLSNQKLVKDLTPEELASVIKQGLVDPSKMNPGKLVSIGPKDLTTLKPEDVWNLKKDVGENSEWTGNKSHDDIVNKTMVQIYHGLKTALEDTIPAIKESSGRYADLLSAKTAIERRVASTAKAPLLGKGGGLSALAGAGMAAVTGGKGAEDIMAGLAGLGLMKAGGSTAVKTRLAQTLAKLGPEEMTSLSKAIPILRNLLIMGGNSPTNPIGSVQSQNDGSQANQNLDLTPVTNQ